MYLNIYYAYIYSKSNISRKSTSYDLKHKEYLLGLLLPRYRPALNASKSNLLQAGKGKTIFVD